MFIHRLRSFLIVVTDLAFKQITGEGEINNEKPKTCFVKP